MSRRCQRNSVSGVAIVAISRKAARPTRYARAASRRRSWTITVNHSGRICFKGRTVNLSHAFAGQNVGVTQVGERIWLVAFMQYDLGYFDDETCRREPIENPFGPKVTDPVRKDRRKMAPQA